MRTCHKCSQQFEQVGDTRICNACAPRACIDCGVVLGYPTRADVQRCGSCKKAYAIVRAGKWYTEKKDRKRAYDAKRREEKRHLYRAAAKRHRTNNPGAKRADVVARRLAIMRRLPLWADRKKLRAIYVACPAGYHVDHVIPLQGKYVSGLHVPDNLQYLPAIENIKKHNHYSLAHAGRK